MSDTTVDLPSVVAEWVSRIKRCTKFEELYEIMADAPQAPGIREALLDKLEGLAGEDPELLHKALISCPFGSKTGKRIQEKLQQVEPAGLVLV